MIRLAPAEIRRYPLTGKHFLVRKSEDGFCIQAREQGLSETPLKTADRVDLAGFNFVELVNKSDMPIDIDVQSSAVPIVTNDGGSVSITGGSIDSIRQPMTFNAVATVEKGSVYVLSGERMLTHADLVIPANESQVILPANPRRRELILQILSDNRTQVRIGGSGVSADAGVLVSGSMDMPDISVLHTSGAITAMNRSAEPTRISMTEVIRDE